MRFDKQIEDNQVLDETELNKDLKINHNLTEIDLDITNVRFALEEQIQKQEMKDSGWRIDKINSLTIHFYKTCEVNRSSYVKFPFRSFVTLDIQNDHKFCFFWSILDHLHTVAGSKNEHSTRVSNYRQYFNDVNIEGYNFTNGFKWSDDKKFKKLNKLSFNLFGLSFYQDQTTWKHKLIPFEVSRNFQIELLTF